MIWYLSFFNFQLNCPWQQKGESMLNNEENSFGWKSQWLAMLSGLINMINGCEEKKVGFNSWGS